MSGSAASAAALPMRMEMSASRWTEYASVRPHVAETASAEAAAHLIRGHVSIARDACQRMGLEGVEALDAPLRAVAWLLAGATGSDAEIAKQTDGLEPLVAYLDERVCVPRDMGGPAAAALAAVLRDADGIET